MMTKGSKHIIRKQLLIAACLNLGHIMSGYTMAWTASVIPKLQDINQTPLSHTISLSQASWIGSIFIISGIIGPYFLVNLSNQIGRKPCLMIGGASCLLGNIIISSAQTYTIILVARSLIGFSIGIINIINFVYIGEIASPNIRGIILTSTAVFHAMGSLLVHCTGAYLSYAATGYLITCVCALHFAGCFYIPESPLFYAIKGKEDEAIKILLKLGRNENTTRELENLMERDGESRNSNWTWKELFKIKSNRKSLIITASLCLFQDCCGMSAVMFYTTTIFQEGLSSVTPEIATIIVGATQFVTTLMGPLFIEKLGRKTLLLISAGGCFICMAILGIYFYCSQIECEVLKHIRWLPLVVMMLSYVSYGFGLNIVPSTFLGEMYRPNVRSIGTTLSITLGWFTNGIAVTSFGYVVEALGSYVVFFTFTVINMIAFIFVLFYIPETKGMTLKDIELMLSH